MYLDHMTNESNQENEVQAMQRYMRTDIEQMLSTINVGDDIEWTNGLGQQERATVFLSRRTNRLAVKLAFSETSVYHMLTIHGRALIVHRV